MDTYTQISEVPAPPKAHITMQTAAYRFHRLCSSCALWIYLYIIFSLCFTDVLADICFHERSVYNRITSSYDSVRTTEDCRWGCCDGNHTTSCCNAPIGLIVGAVFGALLIVSFFIVVLCCCCFFRRRQLQNSSEQRRGRILGFSHDSRSPNDDVSQEAGTVYRTDASGLPEYPGTRHYDPPPSYEDVMMGEMNQAFKPDTDTS